MVPQIDLAIDPRGWARNASALTRSNSARTIADLASSGMAARFRS